MQQRTRQTTSTASINSFSSLMSFSIFKNSSTSSVKTRNIFKQSKKKSIQSNDIVATEFQSSRLEPPFRYILNPKNNLFNDISQLESDEYEYIKLINKLYNTLKVFRLESPVIESLCSCLKSIVQLSQAIKESVEDSPDLVIIKRVSQILKTYGEYLTVYKSIQEMVKDDVSISSKLAFEIEGVKGLLVAPFNQLLGYRHFLRKILKCDQHVCDKPKCDGWCSTKFELNRVNQQASNQLSVIIEECYEVFGIQDNFKMICELENELDLTGCCSVGEDDGVVPIALFLSVPYKDEKNEMAVLPSIMGSEWFEIVPTTKSKKKIEAVKVTLILTDDFLIIAGELDDAVGTRKLLYPPTPLPHLIIHKPLTDGEPIYTIKLSPYKMVLIKPVDFSSVGAFMDNVLKFQKKELHNPTSSPLASPIKKAKKSNSASIGYKLSSDGSSTLTEIIQDCTSNEPKSDSKLFSELCRPYHFNKGEWAKLSRSTMEITLVDGIAVIHVYAEDSKILLCKGFINAIAIVTQITQTRFRVYFVDYEGQGQLYLFQVSSYKQVKDFIDIVEEYRVDYISNLYNRYRPDILPDCPAAVWDRTSTEMKITNLLNKSNCSISFSTGGKDNYGNVNVYIASLSTGDEVVARRMIVRSVWNPLIVLMDIDLAKGKFSIRGNEKLITVRVYYGEDKSIDYEISSVPEYHVICGLVEEAKLKALEYAIALAEREEMERKLKNLELDTVKIVLESHVEIPSHSFSTTLEPSKDIGVSLSNDSTEATNEAMERIDSKEAENFEVIPKPSAIEKSDSNITASEPRPPETPRLQKNPRVLKAAKSSSSLISNLTKRSDAVKGGRMLMMKGCHSDESVDFGFSDSSHTLNRKSIQANQEQLKYHLQTSKNDVDRLYAKFTKLLGENDALEGLVSKRVSK